MKRICTLWLLCIVAIMAAGQEHSRLSDSLMMARVDSIYGQMDKEQRSHLTCNKTTYESEHHFVRAALCGWRQFNSLTSAFGHDVIDYYLADGAVEDAHESADRFRYDFRRKNYLGSTKEREGSFSLYEFIQYLTCNYSQLRERASRKGLRNSERFEKQETRVLTLDDMRVIDSLHRYPAAYAYLSEKDWKTKTFVFDEADREKILEDGAWLLDEKRTTIGTTHPCYALTLSDMAYICAKEVGRSNHADYPRAIELQRQALSIYRITGCQTAVRLAARYLSHLCYRYRLNTYDYKTATHTDYLELIEWTKQEIDSLAPLLGPDSPEMDMARQELKQWEEWRKKHVVNQAWDQVDTIVSHLSAEQEAQLKSQLDKEHCCRRFEADHHYVRAALTECNLYNLLKSSFGSAVCDTIVLYYRKGYRGNKYDNSTIHGLTNIALKYIVLDNSSMDYRITKAMGESFSGQYASDTLKQFNLMAAMPFVKAHQYPQKSLQLARYDDELADLISKDVKQALVQAELLLTMKERAIGKRHPNYALTLSDLAELYMQSTSGMERLDPRRDSLYERAVQMQLQAISIYQKSRLPEAERMSVQFLSNIFYRWDNSGSGWLTNIDDSYRAKLDARKQRELRYIVHKLDETAPEVLATRRELLNLRGYEVDLTAKRHERGNDKRFTDAMALYRQGQYKRAFEEFSSLKHEKFEYLPRRTNYAKQWMAACYLHLGDTAKAAQTDPYYLLPPIDRTKTLEIDYLMRYGNNYHNVLKMAADTLGAGSAVYARMLLEVFEYYHTKSLFTEAADALSRAKTLCHFLLGDDNPLYANILSKLAGLYMNISYYQEAVLTLEESAALTARLQGRYSTAYTNLLWSIVECSKKMDDRHRVAKWLQERIDTDTTLSVEGRHRLMMDFVNNATDKNGLSQTDTATLLHAADFARQVLTYRLSESAAKQPSFADRPQISDTKEYYSEMSKVLNVLRNLAECYKHVGQGEALKELENEWGAWMHNNLDCVTWRSGMHLKTSNSEKIIDQYIHIGILVDCYLRLGEVFRICSNDNLALEAFQHAEEAEVDGKYNVLLLAHEPAPIYDKYLYHINVLKAVALCNLQRYDESVNVYSKAQRLYEEKDGGREDIYYIVDRLLITTLNKMGHHEEAATHLREWWDYQSNAILQQLVVLNGPQREIMWNKKKQNFETIAQCEALRTGSNQTWGLLYDNALLCKGLLLNTEMEIDRAVSRYADGEQAESYRQLKQNQLLLMSELQKPKSVRTVDTDSLQSFIRAQSYALMNTLQGDRSDDLVRQLRTSWTDVQKHLGKKDVAVEFIAVPMKTDSVVYAALTLRPGYVQPHLTTLCTLQQLKDMPAADYYGSSRLYDLLWQPLESELQDVTNIYFAPIGKLHQIGIEYLPGMEQYNTYRLSSTRELMTMSANRNTKIDAALYGGLNFELTDDERDGLSSRHTNTPNGAYRDTPDLSQLREMRGAVQEMPVLEGSLREVADIDSLMRRKHISVTTSMGNDGTEEAFKALSGQHKSLIHISTHGFYQPEQQEQDDDGDDLLSMIGGNRQAQTREDHSLSRSGLLMTGAADFIYGRVDNLSTDDGILTAREISRMDLSGLDLVVLSACETGLGDISGEGVFGLQRGFKKAGAQTLLVSLWKVDDEATQLLMTEFYRGLLSGKTKRQAFIDAQRALRTAQNGRFDRYECWAAFVMIDAL